MPSPTSPRLVSGFLLTVFLAALAVHFHFVTLNWREGFMPGHEFRQTQTALVAHYIDREDNFSIDYSVPILGKPWVLPLEFPAYEWGVVVLHRATGLPLHQAARILSISAFYLTLPALYLLLAQLGLPPPRRLFVLAGALVCPVYIFYARAVLIDSTALMAAVWFLAAFTRMLRDRNWAWFALCVLCGTAAGLIKSLVWFVWVVPAAAYGAWSLWRSWRDAGTTAALRTAAWGLGVMVLPVATALWWSHYTDAIKAAHPSAYIFTSANLARDNYGTFSLSAHFSANTWQNLFTCWQQSLLPPWAFAAIIVPGLIFLPKARRLIAGAAALFLVAQMTIPLAYAYQDYYFYAANLFAVAAIAFTALGLLDTRLPRWLVAPLLLVPLGALFATYRADYFPLQAVRSNGGSGLTEALRAYTPPETILVVAGNDWAPIIPYYTDRKALMIRNGMERDSAYLDRAFADLADEEVSALVVSGPVRQDTAFIQRTTSAFNLDPSPTFSHPTGDVYMSCIFRNETLKALQQPVFDRVVPNGQPEPDAPSDVITPGRARTTFNMVSPAPTRGIARAPFDIAQVDGDRTLFAHADSTLWVPPPPGASHIRCEFGLLPRSYTDPKTQSNGVEFIVEAEAPDGTRRELFRRVLTPVKVASDRGVQAAEFDFTAQPGETVVFRTGTNGNGAFDWAFWRRIEIR